MCTTCVYRDIIFIHWYYIHLSHKTKNWLQLHLPALLSATGFCTHSVGKCCEDGRARSNLDLCRHHRMQQKQGWIMVNLQQNPAPRKYDANILNTRKLHIRSNQVTSTCCQTFVGRVQHFATVNFPYKDCNCLVTSCNPNSCWKNSTIRVAVGATKSRAIKVFTNIQHLKKILCCGTVK
jgi:hypothetical protein